jgi:hypothetical protein
METGTEDSHVLFTLQPPFVYDKNGTWCPHMGVWCSNFPHEPEYHAVPNQPPSFYYSQRGLYQRIFGVPYALRWNVSIDESFPMRMNLTTVTLNKLRDLECDSARYGADPSPNVGGLSPETVDECDRLWALQERLQTDSDLVKWQYYFNKQNQALRYKLPGIPASYSEMLQVATVHSGWGTNGLHDQTAETACRPVGKCNPDWSYRAMRQPFGARVSVDGSYRGGSESPNADGAERDPFTARNITLYPQYTIEKAPGVYLQFRPRRAQLLEYFHVDVYTCYDRLYNKTVLRSERKIGERTVTNAVGQPRLETYEYTEYYNVSVSTTEPICAPAMQVPAANPCPWSRDCRLLGEVSFKLRAYALRTDWVDSPTASGLYTFITGGYPAWMNTRDSCNGWRQSTVHKELMYAVSDHTVWEILAPYDCPPGYHWASTTEALEILELGSDLNGPEESDAMWGTNVTAHTWQSTQADKLMEEGERHGKFSAEMTYKGQCGWDELFWEGKERRYFRFSDSGPRYIQFEPESGATWPEEGYFFRGDYPTTTSSHAASMDVYHSHLTAWYWYQHNENFTLARPYKGPQLYSKPTNATWATKAADSLDYMGLELWTGDNLGHQPKFAGAVCRTNGDWTPPRVVVLGPLIITIEVHTPYIEYGAKAWDPVDDIWFPHWRTRDGVNDTIDDGIVRITGHVDWHNVGIYKMYYDATDLHGNHARQQMRTIIVLDRTIPITTVTEGVHQRVCEPWTEQNCSNPNMPALTGMYTSTPNYPYDGNLSVACPPQHTCADKSGGFLEPRGKRTRGVHITIEAGTEYVELGATGTDNYKGVCGSTNACPPLTDTIVTRYEGPLKNIRSVERKFPVYPYFYMVNKAWTEENQRLAARINPVTGSPFPFTPKTAQQVIDEGLVEDGEALGKQQLEACGYEGFLDYDTTSCNYPSCACGFEWESETEGFADANTDPPQTQRPPNDPFIFNTSSTVVYFREGFSKPSFLNTSQPQTLKFDFVNYMLPGIYNVTYDNEDDYNNTAVQVHKTVTVKDTTPPVLHLLGDPLMIVRYNETFVDPGAYGTDIGDDYYYELNRMQPYKGTVNDTTNETVYSGSNVPGTGYRLNPQNRSAPTATAYTRSTNGWTDAYCNYTTNCTKEHPMAMLSDKIVTKVRHERLECRTVPVYATVNATPPVCVKATNAAPEAKISCPNGTVIDGFLFINFGRPINSVTKQEAQCADMSTDNPVPWEAQEQCSYKPTESGGVTKAPRDVRMFNKLCLGQRSCTLEAKFQFYDPDNTAEYENPCSNVATWLVVVATCQQADLGPPVREDVVCDDKEVQVPQLGVSGLPPLLGRLNHSLPGYRPGQYPLSRFDGTWYKMDDFLSRLDSSLHVLHEKHSHQDVHGEVAYLRTRVGDQWFVNTTINTTVLGLYIITYDVTDMAGNEATQLTRFVIVQDDSELYQNSIQQVYDGSEGTFTGGVLPHEAGGIVRVAGRAEVELARNRPTDALSLWGVHTPSSAAVDGLLDNKYVEPFSKMDEYGRSLAEDHIPNLFMSGPSTFDRSLSVSGLPDANVWWMVHLASYVDNPRVVVYTRDCCTEEFRNKIQMWISKTGQPPQWPGEGGVGGRDASGANAGADGTTAIAGQPDECGELTVAPDGRFEATCTGSGEWLFLSGQGWLHLAEVQVFGYGGGPGQGHGRPASGRPPSDFQGAAQDMADGRRHDVGLHHDGAQYALTVPVANVSTSWWVGVPFASGRQLVVELNVSAAAGRSEFRDVRAHIQHAVWGGYVNGSEVWNMTETGEQRRASDGFIYQGETAHTSFTVKQPTSGPTAFVQGQIEHNLKYGVMSAVTGYTSTCTCNEQIKDTMPCHEQCPPSASDPRLFNIVARTDFQLIEDRSIGGTSGEFFYLTSVEAEMAVEYWEQFYYDFGRAWLANTIGVEAVDGGSSGILDFWASNKHHWLDTRFLAEPVWVRPTVPHGCAVVPSGTLDANGIDQGVYKCGSKLRDPSATTTSEPGGVFRENGDSSPWAATTARAEAGAHPQRAYAAAGAYDPAQYTRNAGSGRTAQRTTFSVSETHDHPGGYFYADGTPAYSTTPPTANPGVGARARQYAEGPRYGLQGRRRAQSEPAASARPVAGFRALPPEMQDLSVEERAAARLAAYRAELANTSSTAMRAPLWMQPREPLTLQTWYGNGVARAVIRAGPRADDLKAGVYFVSVSAEPVVRMDALLRYAHATEPDNTDTDLIREYEYQAVPYSLRTTFIEPILLPSAVDVAGRTLGLSEDVQTLYYFETYLNQKIALELAGPEGAIGGVSAVLHYTEVGDRDDDWGYLGKGRLQTYKTQAARPPGYDFLSLCPHELEVSGRFHLVSGLF